MWRELHFFVARALIILVFVANATYLHNTYFNYKIFTEKREFGIIKMQKVWQSMLEGGDEDGSENVHT